MTSLSKKRSNIGKVVPLCSHGGMNRPSSKEAVEKNIILQKLNKFVNLELPGKAFQWAVEILFE
jgi:hypothetical protein